MSEGKMMGRLTKVVENQTLSGQSSWSFYMDEEFICKATLEELQKQFPYLTYWDMATKEFGQLMLKKVKYLKAFW